MSDMKPYVFLLLIFISFNLSAKLWVKGPGLELIDADKDGFIYYENGHYQYFHTDNNKKIYLTKKRPGKFLAKISRDGKYIAFTDRNELTSKYKLKVIEKKTGRVIKTSDEFFFAYFISWNSPCSLVIASEEKHPIRTYTFKICEDKLAVYPQWFELASTQEKGTWFIGPDIKKQKLKFDHFAYDLRSTLNGQSVGVFSSGTVFAFSAKSKLVKVKSGFFNPDISNNQVLVNNEKKELFLWELTSGTIKKIGNGESPLFRDQKHYFVVMPDGIKEGKL